MPQTQASTLRVVAGGEPRARGTDAMVLDTRRRRMIAFISPCGWGNLGDAAIQDSFLSAVRKRFGDGIDVVGITQNPRDTEQRHGVRTIAMDSESPGFLPVGAGLGTKIDRSAATRSRRIAAIARAARVVGRSLQVAVREVAHWVNAIKQMKSVDTLVVAGGGQLDEYWGGPWKVPYALFKWSLAARLAGRDVVFLSVGAGTLDTRLTRWFLRRALAHAAYVSFRDTRTAAVVRARGLTTSGRVVPDLAFAHPSRERANPTWTSPPLVALSPIAYLDPAVWPVADESAYEDYIGRTATVALTLIDKGYRVVLCTSDSPDIDTADRVAHAIMACAPERGSSLERADTRSTTALLDCLRQADVVIASRLHGVILANLVCKPTIAVSYDWKVDAHAESLGLERFTLPIATYRPEDVVRLVDTALADRSALADVIGQACEQKAAAVEAQYDDLLALGARAR
jgi:polysaccharide pyruvyl transferase WcaK-like protein